MNPIIRKGIGMLLGLVAAGLASIRFMAGFRKNETNWVFPNSSDPLFFISSCLFFDMCAEAYL